MFAPSYFTPTYFTPIYWPPGLRRRIIVAPPLREGGRKRREERDLRDIRDILTILADVLER